MEFYEVCGSCNELTDVRIDTPIDFRAHYVDGAGQLCSGCYEKVYTPENMAEAERWFESTFGGENGR